MMILARDLHRLTLLFFDQRRDMLLRLFDIGGQTNYLDAGLATSLSRDVDGNFELRLQLAFSIATAANQSPMFLDRNFKDLSDLAFPFRHDRLDAGDDLVNDIAPSFYLDGVSIGILLRELDGAGLKSSILGTAGLYYQVTKSGT